jgi:hypothetical protein
MLSLTKVEKGHDCCFFVLWRISFEDFLDDCIVLFCKFKRDGRVVLRCVAML